MRNDECRTKDGPKRRTSVHGRPAFCIRYSAFRIRRAFTLLELVLVMLVLCVLFAMAAPVMSGFGAGRAAQQTASQIVTLSRWAREQAISEGRTYRLNIDPVNQGYWVTASNGAMFERLGVEFGRDFTIPEGVSLTLNTPRVGGTAYLEFLPTGRSQPARISVTARDGAVTELACLSATEPLRVVTPEELQGAALQ